MFLVLLMYALFASVFTIAKIGLSYSQPVFFVGSRMALAGIILLAYQYWTKGSFPRLTKNQWLQMGALGAINIYLTNVFELWGLQFLPSYKTCLFYSLSPFLSALFAYMMFGERMNWKRWLGITIGLFSLTPIFMYQTAQEQLSGEFFSFSFAELAVLMAVLGSVYGWILLQKLVKQGCSPAFANGWSMLLGGGMALIHSMVTENWDPIPVVETGYISFAECTLLLLIISNLICYNLYGYLLSRFSATFLSIAGSVTPFCAAFFGWLYLGETIAAPFYISAVVGTIGVAVFYQDELKRDGLMAKSPMPLT